uniref:Uncharacterized protein n=1 Tax=Glossina palpalis gambiensis TaxID=67801 RepID=A0A1B0BRJ3_9MUSC
MYFVRASGYIDKVVIVYKHIRCSNDGQESQPCRAITKSSMSDATLLNNKMVHKSVGFTANIIIANALRSHRFQAASQSPFKSYITFQESNAHIVIIVLLVLPKQFENRSGRKEYYNQLRLPPFDQVKSGLDLQAKLTNFSTSLCQVPVSNSLNLPCDIDDARRDFLTGKSIPINDNDAMDCITGVSMIDFMESEGQKTVENSLSLLSQICRYGLNNL